MPLTPAPAIRPASSSASSSAPSSASPSASPTASRLASRLASRPASRPAQLRSLLPGAALAVALLAGIASAQLSYGGEPASRHVPLTVPLPTVTMAPVDVSALLAEDEVRAKDGPFRFGATLEVDLSPSSSGAWETLADGSRLWRLRIASPGAFSLSLLFDEFELPGGSRLFAYNDAGTTLLGSYDERSNKPNGQFAIEPVEGDALTVEYHEPPAAAGQGRLRIGAVVHDYRDIVSLFKRAGSFSAAGACEIDVNCPDGFDWQDEKRAVTLLIIGGGLCTGSLINNAANDGTQYFISAFHCGSLSNAVFRFGYEKSGCGSGTAPTNKTVQGSVQLAGDSSKDFRLVRITEAIPSSYAPYYLGWDRSGVAPASSVTIHHPAGDVKKISFDNQAPTKSGVQWRVAQWDKGVTEPGSSGCPLMTPTGRFIGQLFGGESFCGFPFNDYYGRLDQAWASVKTWLDPANTNVNAIDGFDPSGGGGTQPPTLGSVSPTQVTAFQGGTVTLTGTNFSFVTQVSVGALALLPADFTVVSPTSITFEAPQASVLGPVNVTVTTPAGTTAAKTLTFVETNPPKMSASFVGFAGQPFTWSWGAGSGDIVYLLYAPGSATFPFNGFNILAGFSIVYTQVADAAGIGGLTVNLPAGTGNTFINTQVASIDGVTHAFVGASPVSFTFISP
jgi:hypothetical protein